MILYIVITIYILASLVALLRPTFALLFFWPLILCYPGWILYGRFPLNMGFDDLFVICLFAGSLIGTGGRVQAKWPVVAAIIFCILASLGDISSMVLQDIGAAGEIIDGEVVLKSALKRSGIILFLFSVCTIIRTPEQMNKMVYSLLIGAAIGGFFVILYAALPKAYNPFQVPYYLEGKLAHQFQAIGPFDAHDRAGGVLGFTVLLGYYLIRLRKGLIKKQFILLITAVSFVGLLLSGSRSGWLFVAIPVMISSLLSKQKLMGILLVSLMIVAIMISITKFEYLEKRFLHTRDQIESGSLQKASSNRFEIWAEALGHANKRWLLFGEGFAIEETHMHNNYLAMLKNMGMAGLIFWAFFYIKLTRKIAWLKKSEYDRGMSALFHSIFWAYIGYFVFFIPSTPLIWSPVRYIDFFLMALVFLRYNQIETETEYEYVSSDEIQDEAPLDYELV